MTPAPSMTVTTEQCAEARTEKNFESLKKYNLPVKPDKSDFIDSDKTDNNNYVHSDAKDLTGFDIAKFECMEFHPRIRWPDLTAQISLHTVSLYGLYLLLTNQVKLLTTLFALFTIYTSGLGITAGVHRLWSHRAYKATTTLRVLLGILFTITGQRDIYTWALDHRVHHKYTETVADPHDARRGFWFAHVGWLVLTPHPAVEDRRRALRETSLDLIQDPVVRLQKFLSKSTGLPQSLPFHRDLLYAACIQRLPAAFFRSLFIPFFILLNIFLPVYIPVRFWDESLLNSFVISFVTRFTCTLNIAYSVNSFAHLWGNKPYDRFINSVENQVLSLAALGEGWHNYHHVFPWDYRASELGRLNYSTTFIDMCARLGWAFDLKAATREIIMKRAEKSGDGTYKHSHSHIEEPEPTWSGDKKNC